jgi:hypothetical protein
LLKILKETEKDPPGTAVAEVVHGEIDSLVPEQVMRAARALLLATLERSRCATGLRPAAAASGAVKPLRRKPRIVMRIAKQCRPAVRRRMSALPSGGTSAAMH